MRVIKSIHMQGHELLGVTLGDEVSAKKITENNESYYEVYIGDECQDDYLMTNPNPKIEPPTIKNHTKHLKKSPHSIFATHKTQTFF